MNGYERCTKHNLMRCGICNKPPAVTAPHSPTSAPAAGFDPSFEGPSASNVAGVDARPDKQALEAIERNQAIHALPADLAKDVLTDPNIKEGLFELEPPFKVEPRATQNPIVAAAESYSQAQRAAELAIRKVETLRLELQNAENAATDAQNDREVKKAVLQKLVAS